MNFLEKNVTPRDVSQEAKTERLVEEEMSIRGEVASRRSFILLAHFVHSLGRRLVSPAAKSWSDRETEKELFLQFDAHVCNMSIRFIFANSEIQIRKLPFSCMVLGSVPARVVVDVFCLLLHSKKIYWTVLCGVDPYAAPSGRQGRIW